MFRIRQYLDHAPCQDSRLGGKTVVERRLPATGLRHGKVHLASEMFEGFDQGHSHLGRKKIGQAGYEQGHFHGRIV